MGIYPEYDGPVEISHPAEGVTMIRRAEPPTPKQCTHPDCGPTCTVATGPTGAERAPEECCDRCGLPYRVCECCTIPGCEETCADYCQHMGTDDDD